MNPSTALYNTSFYSEGFETATIPNNDWRTNNVFPGNTTWTVTSNAAATGSKSAMITNTAAMINQVDELISPSVDITAITSGTPTLAFKVANAQRTASDVDKLQVYVSTNCGRTWSLRKALQGTFLSTGIVQSTSFVPSAAQWTTYTVSLASYATAQSLLVMFRFTSGGGNNIYLDDININGVVTGIDETPVSVSNMNVYPNPNNGVFSISMDITSKQSIDLNLIDVLGRNVYSYYKGQVAQGHQVFELPLDIKLTPGMYFVTLQIGSNRISKKVIVK